MIRAARFAFPAMAFVLPLIAVLSPHGVAPLGAAGAIALAFEPSVRAQFRVLSRGPLAISLACLLAWAAVSCLWTPHPVESLILDVQVAGVMLAGGLLVAGAQTMDDETGRRSVTALGIGGAVFLLLVATELIDQGVVAHLARGWRGRFTFNPVLYDRAAAIGSIVAWPIARVLWERIRPRAAILFLLLLFAILFQLEMAAARLAFIVGGAAFLISYWKPRPALHAATAVMLVAILAGPPLLVATGVGRDFPELAQELPEQATSAKHRLLIGQFVLGKIAERPFGGFGFDSSRSIPGGQSAAIEGQSVLPLHPHNGILQIWLELGVPGAIGAAIIVFRVLRGLATFDTRGAAATAMATFAAFTTIALISFGIWQNWWLMLAWMAAALVIVAAPATPPDPSAPVPPRRPLASTNRGPRARPCPPSAPS